jgi:Holliday junction resolvase
MKKGSGKGKGSSFEREISRYLTMWLTGQDKELHFWRSPSSGAVATINKGNADIAGDIIAVQPEAEFFTKLFFIECKTGYPKASFHQHLKENKNFDISGFWTKANAEAERSNKYPILIYRKLSYNIIIGIDDRVKDFLKKMVCLPKSVRLNFDNGTPSITFYDMETFFAKVTPNMLRSIECQG